MSDLSSPVFSRVLVGWDGSASAVRSLLTACRLVHAGDGSVVALGVVPTYGHIETDADRTQALEAAENSLTARYRDAVASLPQPRPAMSLTIVRSDHVAESLMAHATGHRFDLIVVGLHGNEGEMHRRLGHVTSHVVKSGRCPVLLIPESADETIHLGDGSALASFRRALQHPFAHHAANLD